MHRGNCMCPAQVFNLIFAKGVNFACHSSSNEESVNYGVGVLFYYSYYPEPRGPNCLSYTMTLFDGKITHSQPGQSVVNQEKLRTMVTQPLSKGLIKWRQCDVKWILWWWNPTLGFSACLTNRKCRRLHLGCIATTTIWSQCGEEASPERAPNTHSGHIIQSNRFLSFETKAVGWFDALQELLLVNAQTRRAHCCSRSAGKRPIVRLRFILWACLRQPWNSGTPKGSLMCKMYPSRASSSFGTVFPSEQCSGTNFRILPPPVSKISVLGYFYAGSGRATRNGRQA